MASASLPLWQAEVHRALGCSTNHARAETSQEENVFEVNSFQDSKRQPRSPDKRKNALSQRPAAMDPELWGNLPIHLLESILSWLPVSTLLKLRCVCKRFNNIIYSPTLLSTLRRINPCVVAWYLFRGEGREYVAFNPEADSWCALPLEFLPGFLPRSKSNLGGRVVAAAGGLLCVLQGEKTIVCNPLRNVRLELPPRRNNWKFPIVGMVMDTEDKEYKVVMAGSHLSSGKHLLATEVYCSRTKTWKVTGTYPVRHHYQTSAVHCNGFLYSAGFDSILAYDMEREQWKEMKGPAVQNAQLMLPQICESNGRLLMVEVVCEHFLMTRVSIWVLQQPCNRWIVLTSMPHVVLEEIISISGHCILLVEKSSLTYPTGLPRDKTLHILRPWRPRLFHDCQTKSSGVQYEPENVEMAAALSICSRVRPSLHNTSLRAPVRIDGLKSCPIV